MSLGPWSPWLDGVLVLLVGKISVRHRASHIPARLQKIVANPCGYLCFLEGQVFPNVFGQDGGDRPLREADFPVLPLQEVQLLVLGEDPPQTLIRTGTHDDLDGSADLTDIDHWSKPPRRRVTFRLRTASISSTKITTRPGRRA